MIEEIDDMTNAQSSPQDPPDVELRPPNDPDLVHLAIDIETLGDPHGCQVIAEVGVVLFTVAGGEIAATQLHLEWAHHLSLVCPTTLQWWMGQEDDARQQLLVQPRLGGEDAAHELVRWLAEHGWNGSDRRSPTVWAYGSTFDVPATERWLQYSGVETPWDFRAVRDARTAVRVLRHELEPAPQPRRPHVAVDDARYTARVGRAFLRLEELRRHQAAELTGVGR